MDTIIQSVESRALCHTNNTLNGYSIIHLLLTTCLSPHTILCKLEHPKRLAVSEILKSLHSFPILMFDVDIN